jgi:hypothetical protein
VENLKSKRREIARNGDERKVRKETTTNYFTSDFSDASASHVTLSYR